MPVPMSVSMILSGLDFDPTDFLLILVGGFFRLWIHSYAPMSGKVPKVDGLVIIVYLFCWLRCGCIMQ